MLVYESTCVLVYRVHVCAGLSSLRVCWSMSPPVCWPMSPLPKLPGSYIALARAMKLGEPGTYLEVSLC